MIRRQITFIAMTCCLAGSLLAKDNVPLDSIVAVVDKTPITQSQLNQTMTQIKSQLQAADQPLPNEHQLNQDVLNLLIDKTLQLNLAKHLGLKASEQDVQQHLQKLAKDSGLSPTDLQAQLAAQGSLGQQQLRDNLLMHQLQRAQVVSHIHISDNEINTMIDKLTEMDRKQIRYKLQHIWVPVATTADKKTQMQAKRIARGLAHSLRQATADLPKTIEGIAITNEAWDWRTSEQLPELFVLPVQSLVTHQISQVIHAPNGYHLLKLLDKQYPKPAQQPMSFHLKQIVRRIPDLAATQFIKQQMDEIYHRLQQGADFAKVAKVSSQQPKTASQGGDTGWLNENDMPPELLQYVKSLSVGELSQPIKVDNAWFLILKVDERENHDPYQQRRQQARQILLQQKFGIGMQNWLQKLRSQAFIQQYI